MVRFVEELFGPLLEQAQVRWAILETVTFEQGQLDCQEVLSLNTLVKGEQLQTFYWDAAKGLRWLMSNIFANILKEEIGNSRSERRLSDLWETFLQEIEGKAGRTPMSGGVAAVRQGSGGPRRTEPAGRSRQMNAGMSNPGMRQLEAEPGVLPARERRRLS